MNYLLYSEVKKIVQDLNINTKDEYRVFQKSLPLDMVDLIPYSPDAIADYAFEWKGWREFLDRPIVIPQDAIEIYDGYYRIGNTVFSTSKGYLKPLAKRINKWGQITSSIRTPKGSKIIYLSKVSLDILNQVQTKLN